MNARIIARRETPLFLGGLCALAVALSGCSSASAHGSTGSNLDETDGGVPMGAGGAGTSAGGSNAIGGSTAAGGENAAGGIAAVGGGSSGAVTGAGGVAGATGGSASTGGQLTQNTGGVAATGGQASVGGTPGAGGAGASGGATGTGGTVAMVNPAPGSKVFIGANFWNIDWEGQQDFFTSGVNFATTTNPWQPAFLTDLAPYHVLRFMDWNMTNFDPNPQSDWSTRTQKTQPQNEPVAFEWQIDLCNRTKKDYWLNIPHQATPDYWTKLAQLVKAQLDPSLRVYVEWSNEVWNGGFPQRAYSTQQGNALGLSGSDPAFSYQSYESVRMFEAFESVFGKGSPRLVKVMSGQVANRGVCDDEMAALADPKINPNGTKPDAYAGAPYFAGNSISDLQSAISDTQQWTTDSIACASAAGLPLISYEGGSDSFAAGNDGCVALQHDPGMHDLYTSYLTGLSTAGQKGPFMQYTHVGGCWGLKEKTGDTNAVSPKYQGVLDWIKANGE